MTHVKIYIDGLLRGHRLAFSDTDTKEHLGIATELMDEQKADHCAIRIEDNEKHGCWLMIGNHNGDRPKLEDLPKKAT